MANKRALVIDAYNVIKVLRGLGTSFEEIAALGCRLDEEPGRSVTPELIAVWFEEEKQACEANVLGVVKKSEPQ